MKNETENKADFAFIVRFLALVLFLILMLWILTQITIIRTEMEVSVDALNNMVATAQENLDNARATAAALDNLRATATARAPVPTSTPTWPISIEVCDSYGPPVRAEHVIESEIEFFTLSYNYLLSAITLTSCAQNYGNPYFEWLYYYIVSGLEELDFGLTVIDPEWQRHRLEQLRAPETDQG